MPPKKKGDSIERSLSQKGKKIKRNNSQPRREISPEVPEKNDDDLGNYLLSF